MTEMPALTTERLSVRPLTSEDFPAYRTLEPDIPDDRQRATLAWRVAGYRELGALLQPPYGERAVALRAGGTLVGLCGLVPAFGPFGLFQCTYGGTPSAFCPAFMDRPCLPAAKLSRW